MTKAPIVHRVCLVNRYIRDTPIPPSHPCRVGPQCNAPIGPPGTSPAIEAISTSYTDGEQDVRCTHGEIDPLLRARGLCICSLRLSKVWAGTG